MTKERDDHTNNKQHSPNDGLMLARRRRRRPNIDPALGQHLVEPAAELHRDHHLLPEKTPNPVKYSSLNKSVNPLKIEKIHGRLQLEVVHYSWMQCVLDIALLENTSL